MDEVNLQQGPEILDEKCHVKSIVVSGAIEMILQKRGSKETNKEDIDDVGDN